MDLQKENNLIQEAFEVEADEVGFCLDQKWGDYENPYENSDTALAFNLFKKGWQAKAQAVLEVKPSRHVTLTCAQLREAFMFGAPDKDDQEQLETEMTITWSENGHSGKGYYCYYSDLPEEGAIFLDDVIEAQEPSNEH